MKNLCKQKKVCKNYFDWQEKPWTYLQIFRKKQKFQSHLTLFRPFKTWSTRHSFKTLSPQLLRSCLNMWVMLFWVHLFILIKCDWRKFFPEIGKWLTLIVKVKKVPYFNSSLKLWIERKYTIELIPVKSHKMLYSNAS